MGIKVWDENELDQNHGHTFLKCALKLFKFLICRKNTLHFVLIMIFKSSIKLFPNISLSIKI